MQFAQPNFAKQFTYPESVDDWIMEAIRKNFVKEIMQVFTFSCIDAFFCNVQNILSI